jgi:hypothetical protein
MIYSLLLAVNIIINGQPQTFPQPPIEQAGRVFVPLRGIFEQLGASVVYQNGTINATGRGRTVSLTIGSTQALVNGQPVTLDSPPFIAGASTLVPLRFVATALGANVQWNDGTSTVVITGGGGPQPNYNNGPPPPPQGGYGPPTLVINNYASGPVPPMAPISANFSVPVRQDSLRITLDGADITAQVDFRGTSFRYVTHRPLPPGRHVVRIQGRTRDGRPINEGWEFRV